jgi:hypothetical protein
MKILAVLVLVTLAAVLPSMCVKSAYAFPCKGGTGEEYCSGYHAGAVQADKDSNTGRVDMTLHPCSQSPDYCRVYENGYNDEAGFLG